MALEGLGRGPKPKGMHWKTFEWLRWQWLRSLEEELAVLGGLLEKMRG